MFGALLGRQKGRSVEICNSYELVVDTTKENKLILDREYFLSKEEQCMYIVHVCVLYMYVYI